jgi:hypothetical protein
MWVRAVAICLACLGFAASETAAYAQPARIALPGHIPRAIRQLLPIGPLPPATTLPLAIDLPVRDTAGLDELLRQLYDPQSTNFHRFLTPDQFAARFGPTETDYQAIVAFAETNGLAIASRHRNRLVLDVEGSVSGIERAFGIKLRTFRHPGEPRDFFAPDRDPSVPAGLSIMAVEGLNDFYLPRPLMRRAIPSLAKPLSGSGPSGYYAGNDFRNAYAPGTVLTGAGQAVGLLEFSDYFQVDITNYENTIGMTNYVPLLTVLVGTKTPGTANNGEVSLDIEMAIAMAPGLSQVIVYEEKSIIPSSILSRMANDNLAKQLSSSWSWNGTPAQNNLDGIFKQMAAQGQSFFQASGDSDAYTGAQILDVATQISQPVDSTNLTAVGATTLTMNGTGSSWASETVWNYAIFGGSTANVGSSGGISTYYAIPYWQTNVSMALNQGSTTFRNLPDVAMVGDQIYVAYNNGSSGGFAGTSCAAPLWAGFTALANQQSVVATGTSLGFLNPALYAVGTGPNYTACFNDIVTGNNIGTNTPGLFVATNGFDLCAGWGTPTGTNLLNALSPRLAFFNQPLSRSAVSGSTVTFNITVLGQPPMAFQWLFNGTNLPSGGNVSGSTSSVLTLSPVAGNNAGNYSLVVSNTYGAITSSVATLTVGIPPAVTAQPASVTNLAGGNVVFSASVTGSPTLAYQWRKNGGNLANGGGISGATSNVLTLTSVTTNSSGNYTLAVTNLFGAATSSVATLTVVLPPAITVQPASRTNLAGTAATFSVAASGTPPLIYSWYFNTTNLLQTGANNSLTLNSVTTGDAGAYFVVVSNLYASVTSSPATLTVVLPPVITSQPVSQTNPVGTTATFSVAASGTAPLSYNWYFNNTNLVQAGTSPSLTINNVSANKAGAYRVIVTNLYAGATSSVATLTVVLPPVIATQPASSTNLEGTPATFSVVASGTAPLTYSWYFNATNLLQTGTNATLALNSVTTNVAGSYQVSVTNPYGAATSSVATLTVVFPPSITAQPASQTVLAGTNVAFSVSADGTPPLGYNWFFNNTNLVQAGPNPVLALNNVTSNNNGAYRVVVTNAYAAVTSGVVMLTVVHLPSFTLEPDGATIDCGGNVTFTVDPSGTPPLDYQWSLDGVPVIGETNTTFSLTNLHLADHTVTITVTNLYGSVTSNALLTVRDLVPPAITLNGANPTFVELGAVFADPGATATDLCAGAVPVFVTGAVNPGVVGTNVLIYTADDGNGNTNSLTRTVIVRDTTPPTILWSFTNLTLAADSNCVARMPDVTGTNFVLAADLSGSLTVSQDPTNGAPLVIGTNLIVVTVADRSGNAAFSTNVILVQDQTPPAILAQPQSLTNTIGETATFTVAATACTPFAVQWFFNSNPIPDQTNKSLTLASVSLNLSGNYYAVLASAGGTSTSTVATLTVTLASSSVTLITSENPAGYRDGVSFTASASPAGATGTIQFLTNGVLFDTETLTLGEAVSTNLASLPRGTNLITALYSGDAHTLPVSSDILQVVTNHPPVAAPAFYTRQADATLTIPIADLATNWNDPDGDLVSLAGIGVSTNGVLVINDDGALFYFNSNNVPDQFLCTISDGWGGTNVQAVNISIASVPPPSLAISGITFRLDGGATLSGVGSAGSALVLESTTNLLPPVIWLPVTTNFTATNGLWQVTDPQGTNYALQFYRVRLVP